MISTKMITRERLRELALEISSANGVLRVMSSRGAATPEYEQDYQDAVQAFDSALDHVACSKCGDCLYDEALSKALLARESGSNV